VVTVTESQVLAPDGRSTPGPARGYGSVPHGPHVALVIFMPPRGNVAVSAPSRRDPGVPLTTSTPTCRLAPSAVEHWLPVSASPNDDTSRGGVGWGFGILLRPCASPTWYPLR
jgi:hypothetical protein